jgi:hypothetical protein
VLHGNIHRHLLALSLANWAVAIVCWTISAYLGIAAPTGIFVYTILFVVGLVAAIVAIACYVLSKFGTEPEAAGTAAPAADDEPAAAAGA